MPAVLRIIKSTVTSRTLLFISTSDLNFLSIGQRSSKFRESLLLSDLCSVDGMPILRLERLMGDEQQSGQTLNLNSNYMMRSLTELGIQYVNRFAEYTSGSSS